jgi:hypothetical protein
MEKKQEAIAGSHGDGGKLGEDDDRVIRNEAEYFSDWHNVKQFLEEVTVAELWKNAWDQKWEAVSTSLLIFQEQPTLLSPHLESVIIPLTNSLIEILQQEEEDETSKKFQVSHFLLLCSHFILVSSC